MNPLIEILARNEGQVLTPELITGILTGVDAALPDALWASLPMRTPPDAISADPRLVCDDRDRVGEWVAQRVGMQGHWGGFGAIGLLHPVEDRLVAGVVLAGLTATNAFMHVAFDGKHALKRSLIYATFDYAFNQLDLTRVTGTVDVDNEAALRFDKHLGFEEEFIIPDGNAGDVVQLVMWRHKCRWLKR